MVNELQSRAAASVNEWHNGAELSDAVVFWCEEAIKKAEIEGWERGQAGKGQLGTHQ